LIECRALLTEYRALLIEDRAVLIHDRALFDGMLGSFDRCKALSVEYAHIQWLKERAQLLRNSLLFDMTKAFKVVAVD